MEWRNGRPAQRRFLRRHLGFTDAEIQLLGLEDVPRAQAEGYLSKHCYLRLRPAMEESGWKFLIYNKLAAGQHFRSVGITMPPLIGLLHPTAGNSSDGAPLRTALDLVNELRSRTSDGFVVKAVSGRGGDRIRIFDGLAFGENGPCFREVDGSTVESHEFDAWTRQRPIRHGFLESTSGFIVEDRIRPARCISQVNEGAAHSVRVYTLQRAAGSTLVQGAFLRLGRPGVSTDHFSKGGIYAPIDLRTGIVGTGAVRHRDGTVRWVESHPDTDERFCGDVLPGFERIHDAAHRAAAATPGLRWMGWDFLIGPGDEPYLLEGNLGWGLAVNQLVLGGFVASGVARDWSEVAGVPLPDGTLRSRWRYNLVLRRSRAVVRTIRTLVGKARHLR